MDPLGNFKFLPREIREKIFSELPPSNIDKVISLASTKMNELYSKSFNAEHNKTLKSTIIKGDPKVSRERSIYNSIAIGIFNNHVVKVAVGSDTNLSLYDMSSNKKHLLENYDLFAPRALSLHFKPEKKTLEVGKPDYRGTVPVKEFSTQDFKASTELERLPINDGGPTCSVNYSFPDVNGRIAYANENFGPIQIFNPSTKKVIAIHDPEVKNREYHCYQVSLGTDHVAALYQGRRETKGSHVRLYSILDQKLCSEFNIAGHCALTNSSLVVLNKNKIHFIDINNPQKETIANLERKFDDMTSSRWDNWTVQVCGEHVVVAGDKDVEIWDASTGTRLHSFEMDGEIQHYALSKGKIAIALEDSIQIRDLQTGEIENNLPTASSPAVIDFKIDDKGYYHIAAKYKNDDLQIWSPRIHIPKVIPSKSLKIFSFARMLSAPFRFVGRLINFIANKIFKLFQR